jgi:hypothetical protein
VRAVVRNEFVADQLEARAAVLRAFGAQIGIGVRDRFVARA